MKINNGEVKTEGGKKISPIFTLLLIIALFFTFIVSACGKSPAEESEKENIVSSFAGNLAEILSTDGGAAAMQHKADVANSGYFSQPDIKNMKSAGSRIILEDYPSVQQKKYYTCGPAAAMTVVRYYVESGRDVDREISAMTENDVASIMGTNPAGGMHPGTDIQGMERYFKKIGWQVESSLEKGSPKTYGDFVQAVKKNLRQGIPMIVENIDWGGHWRVIIGFDSMGDNIPDNDVLILADPYDTTDHLQDGYNLEAAKRFYHMWFDAKLFNREKGGGVTERIWLTAIPKRS